jgi:hypothetical protein
MKLEHSSYNSSIVLLLGRIAIGAAGFFLVVHFVRRFMIGAPPEPLYSFCMGTLAFVGLLAVVISRCLKNLETRLLSQHKNDL